MWKDGLALLLLLVFLILIFDYTVAIRRPWFGVLSADELGYQQISGLMLTAVHYWHQEGPASLHFGMFLARIFNLVFDIPTFQRP